MHFNKKIKKKGIDLTRYLQKFTFQIIETMSVKHDRNRSYFEGI